MAYYTQTSYMRKYKRQYHTSMSLDNTHISHLENLTNNFLNNVCQQMKEIPRIEQQIKRKYIPGYKLWKVTKLPIYDFFTSN